MYVLFVQTLAAYCHHTATMIADSASFSYPCLQQGQSLNRELLNALVTKVNKKIKYFIHLHMQIIASIMIISMHITYRSCHPVDWIKIMLCLSC